MKKLFTLVFCLVSFFAEAQTVDTAAVLREVDSLMRVSNGLNQRQRFDESLQITEAVEKKVIAALGRNHRVYPLCLFNRGNIYYHMGRYAEAEQLWLEVKAIQEKALGKKHHEYADILTSLGMIYWKTGDYEKAELHFLESKNIFETSSGKDHPDYAQTINYLASLYRELGRYEEAEPLFIESNSIQEKNTGKNDPFYAGGLINMANLYYFMGNYEKTELLYLEAKAIFEFGLKNKEHPFYVNCLSNLANLYGEMGNYEKAVPLQIEANVIWEKALRKEHPDYAAGLNNLASLYWEMGNYEKAEPLFLEAEAIWEKTLGKENPDYAMSLNNLATIYRDLGDYQKAKLLYLESNAIWEKTLGKEHPFYGQALFNLGMLYWLIGDYEKTRPFYLEASAIFEKTLGREHPDYAECLYGLVDLFWAVGDFDATKPLLMEAGEIEKSLLVKAVRHLSERELSAYTKGFTKGLNRNLSFAQARKEFFGFCYDNTLFHKGFLLTAANKIKHLPLSDTTSAKQYELLTSYNRRLAQQYAAPIAERDSATVANLEAKANTIEKELTRTVTGFSEALRQVTWQEVKSKLRPGEAAIEFIHYNFYSPKPTDSVFYSALVLRPGDDSPQFVTLCEAKELEALVGETGVRRMDYVANLYQSSGERGASPLRASEKSLYELIWSRLEPLLKGVKTVYYSPSGLLHRLNLNAIAIDEDAILADRYELVELGSTRQLVIPQPPASAAASAIIYGGVRYEMDSTALTTANAGQVSSLASSRGDLNFSYADSTLRGGTWKYLKWTEQEAVNIQNIFKKARIPADLQKGYAATEESFKSIGKASPSPRILHISTHGFFFPDPKTAVRSESVRSEMNEPAFKISDHPMIRSGLILAGADHAWQTGKPFKPDMDDGILTAYEISQMNLAGTELVVLSACETGLGDIEGNEGVYGLQRAFKIAGAKNLIMSLWQVPDQATQELMTAFYQKWLKEKRSIRQALKSAQQEMRAKGLEPYYWAGFVLLE